MSSPQQLEKKLMKKRDYRITHHRFEMFNHMIKYMLEQKYSREELVAMIDDAVYFRKKRLF